MVAVGLLFAGFLLVSLVGFDCMVGGWCWHVGGFRVWVLLVGLIFLCVFAFRLWVVMLTGVLV